MLVVVTGSYRPHESSYNFFSGKQSIFEQSARSLGAQLARSGHVLWVSWSQRNSDSLLGKKEKYNHPYTETADFHALMAFLTEMKETPSLFENGAKVKLLLAAAPGEEIRPFEGSENQNEGVDLKPFIESGWIELEKNISSDPYLRSQLLLQQALRSDVFIVLGGGKATDHAVKAAYDRQTLLPLGFVGGIGHQYLKRMPSLQATLLEMTSKLGEVLSAAAIPGQLLQLLNKPLVVVITIREDEYDAILERLEHKGSYQGKNRTYTTARINHYTGTSYMVGVIRAPEQGPNSAQDTTRDVIEDLDPILIIVTGIGGGIPTTDYSLGDVIVGTRLHDFTVGAVHEDKSPAFTNQGGPMTKMVQDLIAYLPSMRTQLDGWNSRASIGMDRPGRPKTDNKLYGEPTWRKEIIKSLDHNFKQSERTSPIFLTRSIAASANLIKDTKIVEQWLKSARDLAGIDMEFSGAYTATNRMGKEYNLLTIRGISDIVGLKRDSIWTRYACQSAGALCLAILKNLTKRFFER